MNNVNLIGRLTRDPFIKQTASGRPVAYFTLAVNKRLSKQKKNEYESMGKQTADFISIQTWGRQAEFANTYLRKGLLIAVQGSINTYSKDENGTRRYFTDVVANNIEILEKRQNTYSQNEYEQNNYSQDNQNVIDEMSNDFDDSDFPVIDDMSSLPF